MFPLKMVASILCIVILPGCLDVNKFLGGFGSSGSGVKDTTAAVISASSPSGVLSSGTRSIEVRFSTDEAASCKYSTLPNVSFSFMIRSFTTTGMRTHRVRVAGLSEGSRYDYYVRCEDANDNVNDSDYQISFSVENPLDVAAPLLSGGSPNQNQSSTTTTIDLGVTTNENATCRYSSSQGVSFPSMTRSFAMTGATTHSVTIAGLSEGESYDYYVRCEDASNNANDSDYQISFLVEKALDVTAPVLSGGSPNQNQSSATTAVDLGVTTNENATCRYSSSQGVSFPSMTRSFAMTGSTTHSVMIAGLSEGESYDYYVRCEDASNNVNDSDYQISFSVEKSLDVTAPVLSGGSPNQNQSSTTTAVDLGVTTNENASCRYSSSQGVSFPSMTRSFTTTGATTHSVTIDGLSEGESYDYYVRCEDARNNVNDSDYQISFSVEKSLDVTAPVLSGGSPNQDQISTTTTIDLGVTTDENASCRYSTSPGMSYADMPSIFDSTGQTIHTTEVTGLIAENAYVYYVRCADTNTNANSIDYPISFSVLNAVAQGTPWSYVAIPYTDWAYNPFTIQPALPGEWPSSPALNYYYVEPNHPNASDTVQGDELSGTFGRFGYPNRPRISIPSNSWIGDVFAAGTVIWLKGGTYTDSNFRRTWSPQFHGTADAPVWLYGDPTDKPIFSGLRIQLFNSRHAIFDNLQWIGNNRSNSVLTLTRDRAGPTHHITLRNLRFENLNWRGGGGAIVGLTSSTYDGATLSDIVAYKNIFKNNGGGFDWSTKDNDHHGYKVDGRLAGNKTFRIWIIENQALKGDTPDPIDGLYKSLSGNLIQVGDQRSTSGGVHHVYAAGNYQEFARQALGWTKRSHDVIYSSNHCTDTYNLQGGNGQCFGHQYDGDHNWWINNTATNSAAGWMHTSNDATDGRFFIIGNIFHGNKKSDRNDNWRTCAGVSLYNQRGIHYFVNNVFDNNCYGIWAKTNRHTSTSEMHIYNNIFTDFNAVTDTREKAIDLEDSRGIQIFLENNLFGTYASDVSLNGRALSTIQDLNDTTWAAGNLQGDPLYIDKTNKNYNISDNSPAIDAGTQVYSGGAADVYQQFLDRYTNDINYPGDPAEYWPKDYLKQSRIVGGRIDIGPHEWQ